MISRVIVLYQSEIYRIIRVFTLTYIKNMLKNVTLKKNELMMI